METPAQQQYPNLNPYANTNGNSNGTLENAKNSALNTMDSIKQNQTVQNLQNGPMADKARDEAAATRNELSNLAASRGPTSSTAATGQNLTHYHSFFYELLTWSNPRATSIAYALIVVFIFTTRYVPIVRYTLKGAYMVLGITAALEIAGRFIMGEGVATKMRPKKYYTIPRETLESVMEDLVELGNFFVIEFQRIVFAENIGATVGAFATALLTYFLIKITPPWGLALLFTTFAFFTPLIYIKNQDLIDEHINNASDLLNKQAAQVKDLASQHTNNALSASQSAFKDYSNKASEMMGTAKKSAVEKGYVSEETAAKAPGAPATATESIKKTDFPTAPSSEPIAGRDGAADTTMKQEVEETPQLAS